MSIATNRRLWVVVIGAVIALALAVGTTSWFTPAAYSQTDDERAKKPKTQTIRILGFNDFHGNLNPVKFDEDPDDPDNALIDKGGAAYLDAYLDRFEKINPRRTIRIHAGDQVGATPLVSSYFHDEPAVLLSNKMGVDLGTIGNHEFDEGGEEMLRLINGGRRTGDDALKTDADGEQVNTSMRGYPGANYPYVVANVVYRDGGRPVLPPYEIIERRGVKIGFIGVSTLETPDIVVPDAVEPFRFLDISDSVNKYARQLERQDVNAIVVVAHAGGEQLAPRRAEGELIDEVAQMSDNVDVVFGGHTHSEMNLRVDGKLVVESEAFGQQFNSVRLGINPNNGEVVSKSARTIDIFNEGITPSRDIQAIVDDYNEQIEPIAGRVVGNAPETLTRPNRDNPPPPGNDGEGTLGNLIADAQRSVAGADIAFMNAGGIRADIQQGEVTFGDIFTVQPFDNGLNSGELTGTQIKQILEQQFPPAQAANTRKILQPSGVTFTYDQSQPEGERVTEILLEDGTPLDLDATYTVAANSFLITGGDGFTVFREAQNVQSFGSDVDALEQYVDEVLEGNIVAPDDDGERITQAG